VEEDEPVQVCKLFGFDDFFFFFFFLFLALVFACVCWETRTLCDSAKAIVSSF
jgi:hypothetical protein